jgi:putative heme iron utilization protein
MSEQISAEISDRICNHMNEDHANAVVLYAQTFGGLTNATAAAMVAIDPQGMDLTAQVNGENVPVRIEFDHLLQDAEDAHHTLIAMVKQARVPH